MGFAIHSTGCQPHLSALAVRRGFRIPGAGFFIQAKKLGRYGDTSGDATAHATFWVDEVHYIWDYRKNHQTVKKKKGGVPNSAPKVEAWLSGLSLNPPKEGVALASWSGKGVLL